jgi:hypothetical protein
VRLQRRIVGRFQVQRILGANANEIAQTRSEYGQIRTHAVFICGLVFRHSPDAQPNRKKYRRSTFFRKGEERGRD